MILATREQKRQLEHDNAKLPHYLEVVPKHLHPSTDDKNRVQAWRSRNFLVQAFYENDGFIRLSVNRTTLGDNGRWLENIRWEELMQLKREAGFSDWYAIEIYPRDKDVVNVANMRHLWVMEKPLNIGWFKHG